MRGKLTGSSCERRDGKRLRKVAGRTASNQNESFATKFFVAISVAIGGITDIARTPCDVAVDLSGLPRPWPHGKMLRCRGMSDFTHRRVAACYTTVTPSTLELA
jgi:hypothetical protein